MKITKKLTTLILALSMLTATAYASNYWYWQGDSSSDTFAHNIHEGYWNDEYIAKVSVRGSETYYGSGGKYWYPVSSRLTYNMQGHVTRVEIGSNGPMDNTVRKRTTTVMDKWNAGAETKCNYYFQEGINTSINSLIPNDTF